MIRYYKVKIKFQQNKRKEKKTLSQKRIDKNYWNCISILNNFYEFDPKTYMHALYYLKYVNTYIYMHSLSQDRKKTTKTTTNYILLQLTHIITHMTELIFRYHIMCVQFIPVWLVWKLFFIVFLNKIHSMILIMTIMIVN